jgi:hypothetical protein
MLPVTLQPASQYRNDVSVELGCFFLGILMPILARGMVLKESEWCVFWNGVKRREGEGGERGSSSQACRKDLHILAYICFWERIIN